jgi:2-polyprenyl-3-methyl-5-hydroxy-6-metoxy-1,4-benzoquinol methylase
MNSRDQSVMVHRLPKGQLVDRIAYLADQAAGRRVIHVGFADAGFRGMQDHNEAWLHAYLDRSAKELVGIDLDADGVADARSRGYEAYVADCCDPDDLARLDLEPAALVIAGEVIEHLDSPGPFLEGLHRLVAPGGTLIVTTPNAAGWLNPLAALTGYEINHPDHVMTYTWRTLSNLLDRHGWEATAAATFTSEVKDLSGAGLKVRAMSLVARAVIGAERLAARLGAPFVADGLIVVARER